MDLLQQIWERLGEYVNIPYLFTFMLASYGVKTYLGAWLNKITKTKWKTVFSVLIIAAIVAVPYLVTGSPWNEILFSYTLGTSLHETIFAFVEKKLKPKD